MKRISGQEMDDIMVTALEGGITYWASYAQPKDKDYKGATFTSEVLSRNGTIIIGDDDGGKHELTVEKFYKGLEMARKNNGFDIEDYDAGDADNLIQYALFGELVYG